MAKKAQITPKVPDPTLPDVAVEIEGTSYRLCFDFASLAVAKAQLKQNGIEINILRALDFRALDVDQLPAIFFAAALRFQPNLTWETALDLVSMRTYGPIAVALWAAYQASMVESSSNPPRAALQN